MDEKKTVCLINVLACVKLIVHVHRVVNSNKVSDTVVRKLQK